ncbi:BRCT domain containing protein [Pseudohyphozyma bogoriensis]|nr:BRCT domain containing protein [Pseudohyphozyma bogoriensis]
MSHPANPSARASPKIDAFVVRTKPSEAGPSGSTKHPPTKPTRSAKPYSRPPPKTLVDGGIRRANKANLATLQDADNPITHSTAYERHMHIQSCATGHQSGGGGHSSWRVHRNTKLKNQAAEKTGAVLAGVVAYINGYTGGITNLELIALVQANGGEIRYIPSASCTHIFSTQGLSGSKSHKFFTSKKVSKTKVVTPNWAIQSVASGKRMNEANFQVLHHDIQTSMHAILRDKGALADHRPKKHVSAYECAADVLEGRGISFSPPTAPLPSPKERPTTPKRSSPRTLPPLKKKSSTVDVLVIEDSPELSPQVGFDVAEDTEETEEEEEEEEEEDTKEEVTLSGVIDDLMDGWDDQELDDWGMPPSGQRGQ